MTYALILAGGSGKRFWPLSREHDPKQFLHICSHKSMLEETIERIHHLIRRENIYLATNKIYYKKLKGCLKSLKVLPGNIFFEPEGKNTFAPIAFCSGKIYLQDKEAVILVLPCDHYIKDKTKFLKALTEAVSLAKRGYIVTLGITPDRPETGYGYIKAKSKISRPNREKIYKVERFIEKPDLSRAKKFIRDRRYYWNGGIFIFKADLMLEEIKKFMPRDYQLLTKIRDNQSLGKLWPRLASISIDYAVMEKTHRAALIPVDFGWMDLGSWCAVESLLKKDKDGNIFNGNCIDIGSKNTLTWSDNRLLATIGLENMIIVNTKDAVLVCSKDKVQEVKSLTQILKERKLYKQI